MEALAEKWAVRYLFQASDSLPRLRPPLRISLYGDAVMVRDAVDISVYTLWFDDGCPEWR